MTDLDSNSLPKDKESDVDGSKSPDSSELPDDDKTKENSEETKDSLRSVSKRAKSDDDTQEDSPKRKKSLFANEPTPSDDSKSVIKESGGEKSIFDVLTNTKEYDCPIAKLAKMNSENKFFDLPKPEVASNLDLNAGFTFDANDNDDDDVNQVALESSLSDCEILLTELKDCKLSVYRDSEWSVPIPVVTHLILNEDTSIKRLVSFQLGTGRLLLNTVLLPSMSFKKLKNKSIIFTGQTVGENSTLVPHRLLFNDTSSRDDFHKLYSE